MREGCDDLSHVVVAGGGWAGCAAALQAAKKGIHVTLLERTDMLLGTGLVGGIMRNNGRFTAAEEMLAMGGGELFKLTDDLARHRSIKFPGHHHAFLYDIVQVVGGVEKLLEQAGVEVLYFHRIEKVEIADRVIKRVVTKSNNTIEGDVFIDATGTAGPMKNCISFGNGCAMCIYRCPSFGGRVSLTELAGIREIRGMGKDGTIGAMSGSCKLLKESLEPGLVDELEREGVVVIDIPPSIRQQINMDLGKKACQQYNRKEFLENLILLDTGHAKLMASYFPLKYLKKIPGFENARFEDPYAGGMGNSMRFIAMAPRDNAMKVEGVDNLFCAGEKSGLLVGHTEAICTGVLAGYNAACLAKGKATIELPETTVIGDAIAYVRKQMKTEEGRREKYTFSGSVYFERMEKLGFYTTDLNEIQRRIADSGCLDIFTSC